MNKALKIFAGLVVVLLVFFMGVGIYMGGSVDEMYQEVVPAAEAFASKATKDECLERYVSDYKQCSELSCYSKSAMFGVVCLASANGDSAIFCSDKPKSQSEFYNSQWKQEFCASSGLDDQDCLSVYKIIETHCRA